MVLVATFVLYIIIYNLVAIQFLAQTNKRSDQ